MVAKMIAAGILGAIVFIGWLIWRAAKKGPIKASIVMYGLSCLAGIFTFAFFLSMDIPEMVKILVCIVLGAAMIFVAAWSQRRINTG